MARTQIVVGIALVGCGIGAMVALTAANSVGARQRGCDRGDKTDCANLAFRYEVGNGVPRDDQRAFALYQRACDLGSDWGCGALGSFYEYGRTVPVDYARAYTLFDRGCAARVTVACNGLAELLRDGHGTAADLPRALMLFQRVCADSAPHGRYARPSGHELGCDAARDLTARLANGAGH